MDAAAADTGNDLVVCLDRGRGGAGKRERKAKTQNTPFFPLSSLQCEGSFFFFLFCFINSSLINTR